MAARLEKTYECLTCKQDIKLERKPDNSGRNKYNLDESVHIDEKKKPPSSSPQSKQSQQQELAALRSEVSQLRAEMKIVIAQLQGLRSDINKELKKL